MEELSLVEDGGYREEPEEQASTEQARKIEEYRKQVKRWQNEAAYGEYTSSSDDDGSDIFRWSRPTVDRRRSRASVDSSRSKADRSRNKAYRSRNKADRSRNKADRSRRQNAARERSQSMFSQEDSEEEQSVLEVTGEDLIELPTVATDTPSTQQTEHPDTQSSQPAGRGKWKVCGVCNSCLRRDDCKLCNSCKDKISQGGPGRLKERCKLRRCQHKTRLPNSLPSSASQSQNRPSVRRHTQGTATPRERGDTVELEPAEVVEVQIEASDLGFAKTKGKTYFPAWRVSQQRDRIKVVFFFTGQSATIHISSWLPYSADVECKLVADSRVNTGSFGHALAELARLQARLERDGDLGELQPVALPVTGSQIPAHLAGQPRKLGKMSNPRFQQDEAVNHKVFGDKIVELERDGMYGCRLCPGKRLAGLFAAKRHARQCGTSRPKLLPVRTKVPKHWCSVASCGQKFTSKEQLNKHYQSEHSEGIRPHRCWTCKCNFASYKILKRHMTEHHSVQKPLFQCEVCPFSSQRKFNLQVHIRSKHGEQNPIINNEGDISEEEFEESRIVKALREKIDLEMRWCGNSEAEQRRREALEEQLKIALEVGLDEEDRERILLSKRAKKEAAQKKLANQKRRAESQLAQVRRKSQRLASDQGEVDDQLRDQTPTEQIPVSRWDKFLPPPREPSSDEEDDDRFACSVCHNAFPSGSKLRRHTDSMHKVGLVVCFRTYCSQTFLTKHAMLEHSRECKLTCIECNWSTTRPESWTSHMRKHERES